MRQKYSWEDADQILKQEMKTDALVAALTNNLIPSETVIQTMFQESKALDDACRYFSRKGKWPHVSAELAYGLFVRVKYGRDALKFLRRCTTPNCSISRMIEYLLIDHWRSYGKFRFPRS